MCLSLTGLLLSCPVLLLSPCACVCVSVCSYRRPATKDSQRRGLGDLRASPGQPHFAGRTSFQFKNKVNAHQCCATSSLNTYVLRVHRLSKSEVETDKDLHSFIHSFTSLLELSTTPLSGISQLVIKPADERQSVGGVSSIPRGSVEPL